jgi:hypothetical protein
VADLALRLTVGDGGSTSGWMTKIDPRADDGGDAAT